MANSNMTVKFYRSRLNGELSSGLSSNNRLDFLELMLEKSKNWPEDTILSVSKSLRAKASKTNTYTSRVSFSEAVEMTVEHTERIRKSSTMGTNGVCKVDGLGWVMVSSNTSNVSHSFETMKWDMTIGHSNIKEGEKVFVLPRMNESLKTGIMATAGNDAFPLSKSTQDLNWK